MQESKRIGTNYYSSVLQQSLHSLLSLLASLPSLGMLLRAFTSVREVSDFFCMSGFPGGYLLGNDSMKYLLVDFSLYGAKKGVRSDNCTELNARYSSMYFFVFLRN